MTRSAGASSISISGRFFSCSATSRPPAPPTISARSILSARSATVRARGWTAGCSSRLPLPPRPKAAPHASSRLAAMPCVAFAKRAKSSPSRSAGRSARSGGARRLDWTCPLCNEVARRRRDKASIGRARASVVRQRRPTFTAMNVVLPKLPPIRRCEVSKGHAAGRLMAQTAASVRLRTWSLRSTPLRWTLTVAALMVSSRAISLFE
jgi:hypothetical protein